MGDLAIVGFFSLSPRTDQNPSRIRSGNGGIPPLPFPIGLFKSTVEGGAEGRGEDSGVALQQIPMIRLVPVPFYAR